MGTRAANNDFHRYAIMAHLPPLAQKWITTTHLDWLKETPELGEIARFRVIDGMCEN